MGDFFSKLFKFVFVIAILAIFSYGGYVYGQSVLQDSLFKVNIPINQTVSLELNQMVIFPVKTQVSIPLNETVRIQKNIPISVSIPIKTTIKAPVETSEGVVYMDVPIDAIVPVSTSFFLDENVLISKNVTIPIDSVLNVPINKTFEIPIDTMVETRVPIPEWMDR